MNQSTQKLQNFRNEVYQLLGPAKDSTFELMDAVLITRNVYSFGDDSGYNGRKKDAETMTSLMMPPERKFGWALKTTSSTDFAIHKRDNDQFCVVLNHALLRGVTSEMIYWWFRHFQNIKVTLDDIEGYEGKAVPAYLLWHPSDHFNATLKRKIGSQ